MDSVPVVVDMCFVNCKGLAQQVTPVVRGSPHTLHLLVTGVEHWR